MLSILMICATVVIVVGLVVYAYIYNQRNGRRALKDHGVKGLNALTAYNKAWTNPLAGLASLASLISALIRRNTASSVTEPAAEPDPVADIPA
ncbi:hypothetical protein ACFU44_17470 [Nocardia rhizosphaerihabitans]|uniref:hypothetical protein n=1 Tax=Nocardia rhizosphaerihabitans TaxID=1691570 RepID=UPI00366EF268